jgi:hypothetical protein
MDTNTATRDALKEVRSSPEQQDWWSYDPQGQSGENMQTQRQSGECMQAQQVLLSNAESLAYERQQSEFNREDAVDLGDVINIPPASDNWNDESDVDDGNDDDDDVEYNGADNPFAGLDSDDEVSDDESPKEFQWTSEMEQSHQDWRAKEDQRVLEKEMEEVGASDSVHTGELKPYQPEWNQPKKKTKKKRKWTPPDLSFLGPIQTPDYVNFGKLTKFFEGQGCEYVDDFTRVGILTMGDDGKLMFNLKSGVISIGGVVNCLIVDRKSGSRILSDYLKKVTSFLEDGLYCPRQFWQHVKYALGLLKVLDVVMGIVHVDDPVRLAFKDVCWDWSNCIKCNILDVKMERKDGIWEAIDTQTDQVLELRFEETLEAHLPDEFSAKLAQLVEKEKQKRIQRQWEERREEQRRRAAMPDAARIIQRAWLRLVDRRAEAEALAESDERIRTALIVIGSYFVGVASVIATSFF